MDEALENQNGSADHYARSSSRSASPRRKRSLGTGTLGTDRSVVGLQRE